MRQTPDPLLPLKRCETCYAETQFLFTYKGRQRCRECLLDTLGHGPSRRDRNRILRLLKGPDFAQGEFDYGGNDDGE